METNGEHLSSYGCGGGIHFVWQDAERQATPRTVTDDHVRQWLKTEEGERFARDGYRLVHLSSYAGPVLVANIRRTGADTLTCDGKVYTYQVIRRGDHPIHYHDLTVTFRLVHNGEDMGEHELKHISTKEAILCFLSHEAEIVSQTT